jgi:hypothetical protein
MVLASEHTALSIGTWAEASLRGLTCSIFRACVIRTQAHSSTWAYACPLSRRFCTGILHDDPLFKSSS